MFERPGTLYVYFSYGMHVCANVVTSPFGEASAILLRAGEVVDGLELARSRRVTSKTDADLARGPARLCVALGITLADGGDDLENGPIRLVLPDAAAAPVVYAQGPRTGVSGAGGSEKYPWRFWIPGDRTVSPYKKSPR
jgi:DNA-3-methyladenine glycosylase